MTARSGQADRYEQQDVAFHETLRHAFLKLCEQEPQRFTIIDAAQDADSVRAQILRVVSNLIEAA